jgi:hypothetical protein
MGNTDGPLGNREPFQYDVDAAIDTIRRIVPIEIYAATLTELEPDGGGKLVGLCPMHIEDSPTFEVDPEGQRFSCGGPCPSGVGVIGLFRVVEGGMVESAISALAERFGIELPAISERRDSTLTAGTRHPRHRRKGSELPPEFRAAPEFDVARLSVHRRRSGVISITPPDSARAAREGVIRIG